MVRLTTLTTTLCTTISLALCTMGVISHVGLGAAMPSVISDGDFYCEGGIVGALCTVPPTSTILNIQNMVNSAVAASNASASFYALRASFLGTLFVNAPTSTAPAIPVHISIVNGSSHNSLQKGGVGFLVGFGGRLGNYYEAIASVVSVLRVVSATTLDPNTGIVVANVAVVGMMRLLEAYPIWLLSGFYRNLQLHIRYKQHRRPFFYDANSVRCVGTRSNCEQFVRGDLHLGSHPGVLRG